MAQISRRGRVAEDSLGNLNKEVEPYVSWTFFLSKADLLLFPYVGH